MRSHHSKLKESAVMQSAMSNSLIASILATLSSSYNLLRQYVDYKLLATASQNVSLSRAGQNVLLKAAHYFALKVFGFSNVPSILFAAS